MTPQPPHFAIDAMLPAPPPPPREPPHPPPFAVDAMVPAAAIPDGLPSAPRECEHRLTAAVAAFPLRIAALAGGTSTFAKTTSVEVSGSPRPRGGGRAGVPAPPPAAGPRGPPPGGGRGRLPPPLCAASPASPRLTFPLPACVRVVRCAHAAAVLGLRPHAAAAPLGGGGTHKPSCPSSAR